MDFQICERFQNLYWHSLLWQIPLWEPWFLPSSKPFCMGRGSFHFKGNFTRKKKFTKAKKLVGFLFHLDRDYINSSEDFVYQKMSVLLDILIEASLGFGQGWRNLEREGGHVCHSIWNTDAKFFLSPQHIMFISILYLVIVILSGS